LRDQIFGDDRTHEHALSVPISESRDATLHSSLAFTQDCGNNGSMSDVVQSVRQLLQDFIAPELRELKSDVKQVDAKVDLETKNLKAQIDSETGQIRTNIKRLEDKMDSEFHRLEDKMDSDFKRFEDKMDSGFTQMRTLLENAYLRSELDATRDISNLREA
jgi:hypothetical protein